MWEWGLRTDENVWSEGVWKIYGLAPQSCAPSYESWRRTIHPDDLEAAERAVQESSPAALLLARLSHGQYLAVNDAYCASVGYERAQLIGRRTTDFAIYIASTDRRKLVAQLLSKGSIRGFEMQIRHRYGEVRDVLAGQELVVAAGEECIVSTYMDIIERKRKRHSRERTGGHTFGISHRQPLPA